MRMNNSINLTKKDDIDSQVDNDIQPLFLPNELLHVGNHSDDYDRSQIIKKRQRNSLKVMNLTRTFISDMMREHDYRRPKRIAVSKRKKITK